MTIKIQKSYGDLIGLIHINNMKIGTLTVNNYTIDVQLDNPSNIYLI